LKKSDKEIKTRSQIYSRISDVFGKIDEGGMFAEVLGNSGNNCETTSHCV
jgi:hypothetical protein